MYEREGVKYYFYDILANFLTTFSINIIASISVKIIVFLIKKWQYIIIFIKFVFYLEKFPFH